VRAKIHVINDNHEDNIQFFSKRLKEVKYEMLEVMDWGKSFHTADARLQVRVTKRYFSEHKFDPILRYAVAAAGLRLRNRSTAHSLH